VEVLAWRDGVVVGEHDAEDGAEEGGVGHEPVVDVRVARAQEPPGAEGHADEGGQEGACVCAGTGRWGGSCVIDPIFLAVGCRLLLPLLLIDDPSFLQTPLITHMQRERVREITSTEIEVSWGHVRKIHCGAHEIGGDVRCHGGGGENEQDDGVKRLASLRAVRQDLEGGERDAPVGGVGGGGGGDEGADEAEGEAGVFGFVWMVVVWAAGQSPRIPQVS
jgi:hypothetical protein